MKQFPNLEHCQVAYKEMAPAIPALQNMSFEEASINYFWLMVLFNRAILLQSKNPPTCDQLLQAFEVLAARDHKLARMTFAQAMAHETWARVIDCKARATRTAHYRATTTRRVRHVRRYNPATDTWCTQCLPGAFDESQPLIA